MSMDSMTEVYPRLYVGDLQSVQQHDQLQAAGITHVLSTVDPSVPRFPNIHYHQIRLLDISDENLLQHLNATTTFIGQALEKGGRVLVHCVAGMSRSGAVAVAYVMKAETMTYEQALARVQQARSMVCPNEGFAMQCRLYAEMNYQVDTMHSLYRRWLNGQLTGSEVTGIPSQVAAVETAAIAATAAATAEHLSFRCRMCRHPLATSENLVPHEVGAGQTAFAPRRRELAAMVAGRNITCASHFIEPLSWIDGVNDGSFEGRILCPKCSAKLGQYNWSGAQCSCGAWVTPAIALHRTKVDTMPIPSPSRTK